MLNQLNQAFKDCPPGTQFLVSVLYKKANGETDVHPAFEIKLVPDLQEVAAIGEDLLTFRSWMLPPIALSVRAVTPLAGTVVEISMQQCPTST